MDIIASVEAIIIIFLILIILQNYRRNKLPVVGKIVITKDDNGKKMFSLEVDIDPDGIEQLKEVKFLVTDEPSEDL